VLAFELDSPSALLDHFPTGRVLVDSTPAPGLAFPDDAVWTPAMVGYQPQRIL